MSASVSPEVIRDLDSRVRFDLQQLDDRFFWWVAASAIVVAIGCMMEGPEILHELWPNVFPVFKGRWVKYVGLVGWFFVVLGVAGEGVLEIYDHHASGLLQTFDEVLLADAQRNAGDAQLSASAASDAARTAREQSDAATASVAVARQEADSLTQEIVAAKQRSADASNKAADAVSRLAAAEQELADATQKELAAEEALRSLKTPRSLANSEALVALLKPFKGTTYTIQAFANQEAFDLTREIDKALGDAGWVRKEPTVRPLGLQYFDIGKDLKSVPGCLEVGVNVHVRSEIPLDTLMATPVQNLPKDIQIAALLRGALAPSISPSDDRNIGAKVTIDDATDKDRYAGTGDGPVIICVGQKP